MIEKLKQLGFGRIIIADDYEENLSAAKKLEERLPGIHFEYFQRGDLIIAQIPKRHQEIGLILTDRKMETEDAGLDVAQIAWSYLIPTFVCSGGYTHRNLPRVRVAPHVKALHLEDGMTKDIPDTWHIILEGIVNDATGEKGTLLQSALRARKVGIPIPSDFTGEQARRVVQGYLDLGHKEV